MSAATPSRRQTSVTCGAANEGFSRTASAAARRCRAPPRRRPLSRQQDADAVAGADPGLRGELRATAQVRRLDLARVSSPSSSASSVRVRAADRAGDDRGGGVRATARSGHRQGGRPCRGASPRRAPARASSPTSTARRASRRQPRAAGGGAPRRRRHGAATPGSASQLAAHLRRGHELGERAQDRLRRAVGRAQEDERGAAGRVAQPDPPRCSIPRPGSTRRRGPRRTPRLHEAADLGGPDVHTHPVPGADPGGRSGPRGRRRRTSPGRPGSSSGPR